MRVKEESKAGTFKTMRETQGRGDGLASAMLAANVMEDGALQKMKAS
jgi:hypothetical protein